ncbi:MAG: 4-hydroxy-tetrahydrodipicolinate synthase [Clostridiales bacterium]|nr:4-hydroxy-tetrahydrodipicolinate synthase [Clostridiales bacterium]
MENKNLIFTRTATAVATPFKNGSVDFGALGNMIEFQIKNGINALLFCGTTGESSTMPDDEHMAVIRFGIKKTAGRIPVIANTGSNDTAHAIELSKMAQDAGADALLSVAPYYNKTSQKGLVAHFSEIAKNVELPIILYNVPTRTVVNIDAATTIELSEIPNIVAVKECNLSQAADIVYGTDDDFSVYSGNDEMVLEFMALGAKGLISVMSNIVPSESQLITEAFLNGDSETAMNEYYKIFPLIKALGQDVNPIPVKKALELMGLCTGDVRLPLIKMEEHQTKILRTEMTDLGLL